MRLLIHSPNLTVEVWEWISIIFQNWTRGYSSMLEIKLNHISQRGPRCCHRWYCSMNIIFSTWSPCSADCAGDGLSLRCHVVHENSDNYWYVNMITPQPSGIMRKFLILTCTLQSFKLPGRVRSHESYHIVMRFEWCRGEISLWNSPPSAMNVANYLI